VRAASFTGADDRPKRTAGSRAAWFRPGLLKEARAFAALIAEGRRALVLAKER